MAARPVVQVADERIERIGLARDVRRFFPLVEEQGDRAVADRGHGADQVAGLLVGERRQLDAAGLEALIGFDQAVDRLLDRDRDGLGRLADDLLEDLGDGLGDARQEVRLLLLPDHLGLLPVAGIRQPAGVEVDHGAEQEVRGLAEGLGKADQVAGLVVLRQASGELGQEPALAHLRAGSDRGQALEADARAERLEVALAPEQLRAAVGEGPGRRQSMVPRIASLTLS